MKEEWSKEIPIMVAGAKKESFLYSLTLRSSVLITCGISSFRF